MGIQLFMLDGCLRYLLQIRNLVDIFHDSIAHSDWLSKETAVRAEEKLSKLRYDKVAFPPILSDDAALDAAYANYNVSGVLTLLECDALPVIQLALSNTHTRSTHCLPGNFSFLENAINLARMTTSTSLSALWTDSKPDPQTWPCSAATMNAFYNAPTNEMVLPIAMLSPPFYDNKYPRSLVYGGIGAVIGHELVHAFDDQGIVL